MFRSFIYIMAIIGLLFSGSFVSAQDSPDDVSGEETNVEQAAADAKNDAIKMLLSIVELKKDLAKQIQAKKAAIQATESDAEIKRLKEELDKLDNQFVQANIDFEKTATGVDISLFDEKEEVPFDWKDELVSLLKPGIVELKSLTAKARHRSQLKEDLATYETLQSVSQQANENLRTLMDKLDNPDAVESVKGLTSEWGSIENQIENRLDIIQMELDSIEAEKTSLVESGRNSIRHFFKTRGLYLTIAVLACIVLVLLLKLIHSGIKKSLPGYSNPYRPFHFRAIDLGFKVMTVVFTLVTLLLVFYIFEDWVLLSLCVIVLLSIGWTAKTALPRYWAQSRLMLNIGAVREGERLVLENIPWLVKKINLYSVLENPDLGITLRVPIKILLDKTSRVYDRKESWFPCRKEDWVILADGVRGHVVSLSHEMVELVLRGGARKIYQTQDFLAQAPLNLSANFRIRTLFGISYDLQAQATTRVLEILEQFIRERIDAEGYGESLLNLRVEFAQAGGSSLDLIVISDFKGDMAPLYSRLERALQRWCVDASTANNWEIPFPQLTVHPADGAPESS